MNGDLPVLFEGSAFMLHRRSGISRYLAELIGAYQSDPGLGVHPVTPYAWVTSVHAGHLPGMRSLPLHYRVRRPTLSRLNATRARRAADWRVAHLPMYVPEALVLANGRPSVTTVYDFTLELFPELFSADALAGLECKQRFLESCDVLLCISQTTAADLARLHPRLDKPIVVTPLGVGPEFSRRAARAVRGLPARYLLCVGNRAAHKNVNLLLRAFAVLARQDPDLHLVLSGSGLPDERAEIARLGIAGRTHLVKVSDADLPSLYQHAAAFVLPSRYEGFGLPLVEAMAAGTPSVISSAPALIEVAAGCAEVVDPDDVEGVVGCLDRILGDSAHREKLRSAGRTRARDFTWHATAAATARAYQIADSLV